MRYFECDRCTTMVRGDVSDKGCSIYIAGNIQRFELCSECEEALLVWIKSTHDASDEVTPKSEAQP